ncbi:hypothetical protein T492DRAFT_93760 [Pavlovales sp. CCMP2436]|nr:hypothetical protein T492DRAFT_93760 [Pavlovales sp. CCMP2436]
MMTVTHRGKNTGQISRKYQIIIIHGLRRTCVITIIAIPIAILYYYNTWTVMHLPQDDFFSSFFFLLCITGRLSFVSLLPSFVSLLPSFVSLLSSLSSFFRLSSFVSRLSSFISRLSSSFFLFSIRIRIRIL